MLEHILKQVNHFYSYTQTQARAKFYGPFKKILYQVISHKRPIFISTIFMFLFFFFVFRQNFHGRCSQTTTPSIFITSDTLEFLGYDVIPRTQQQNFANFVSGHQIQKSLCLCPQFFCLFFSSSGTHFLSLSFFNYFKTMHPKTGRNKFQQALVCLNGFVAHLLCFKTIRYVF